MVTRTQLDFILEKSQLSLVYWEFEVLDRVEFLELTGIYVLLSSPCGE